MKIKNILINSFANGLASTILPILAFIYMTIVISHWGIEKFGWLLVCQMLTLRGGFINLFEFGIQTGVARCVVELFNNNQYVQLNYLIYTSLVIVFGIGLILGILGIINSLHIAKFFNIPVDLNPDLITAIKLIFLSYPLQMLTFVFAGVLEGLQKYKTISSVLIISSIINLLGAFIVINLDAGIFYLIVLMLFSLLLQPLLYFVSFRKIFTRFSFVEYQWSKQALSELYSIVKYTFPNKISGILFWQVDRLIITTVLGPSILALYEIIIRVPAGLKQLVSIGSSALMPFAGELYTSGSKEEIKKLFRGALKFNLYFSIPITSYFIITSKFMIMVWLGEDYLYISQLISFQLIWILFFPLGVGWPILLGIKEKLKASVLLSWAGVICKTFLLITIGISMGLYGVVFSNIIPQVFIPVIGFIIMMKEFNLKLSEVLNEFLILSLSMAFPISLTLSILSNNFLNFNIITYILFGFMFCLISWTMLYIIGLDKAHKNYLKNSILKTLSNSKT